MHRGLHLCTVPSSSDKLKTNFPKSEVLLKAMVMNISAVLSSLVLVVGGGLFQANMCEYIFLFFFNGTSHIVSKSFHCMYMYVHHLRLC